MRINLDTFCKINLSLRIYSKGENGFHRLESLFLKIPKVERLTIGRRNNKKGNDLIRAHGQVLKGENILFDVLGYARTSMGWKIPPLEIDIWKKIPPGTGLGGGSANASALLQWIIDRYGRNRKYDPSIIGSDVAFFFSPSRLAIVTGEGETVEALANFSQELKLVIFIPSWRSSTPRAYSLLDTEREKNGFSQSMCYSNPDDEIMNIYSTLDSGRRYGLLPNDFMPLLSIQNPEYLHLFSFLENTEALAWGISGSGSAAFGIFSSNSILPDMMECKTIFKWLENTLVLE